MYYDQCEFTVSSSKCFDEVIPPKTRSYEENLRKLKPNYIVWQKELLAKDRKEASYILAEWGENVIDPDLTECLLMVLIHENVFNHVRCDKQLAVGGRNWRIIGESTETY